MKIMPEDRDCCTKIVLLGTGTPNADPKRSGPSTAIIVQDRAYLIDFGPGVVRRAAAAHELGIKALEPNHLELAFLTHLHSDHTSGFPDLILTPWVLGRKKPLTVYGPRGLRHLTNHIILAYEADIEERLTGLEPANSTGYHVIVNEIKAGMIYQDRLVCVEAFPARHGSWDAYGYCFYTPNRKIVISGDTAPNKDALIAFKNCDVLIHEAYSTRNYRNLSQDWQRYHRSVHTSTSELAEIAHQVRPKLLILNHQLFWGTDEEEFLDEIRQLYQGDIVSGKDLGVY